MLLRFRVTWPTGTDVASVDLPWLDVTPDVVSETRDLLVRLYATDDVVRLEDD